MPEQYQLTSTLKMILQEESPEARAAAANHVDQYITDIQRVPSSKRSRVLQMSVDDAVRQDQERSKEAQHIQCRKGCDFCCQQIVAITPNEATRLHQVARHNDITLDLEKLKRQAAIQSEEAWIAQSGEDRNCVFLGADHLCQVYAERPMSCRKYFVISDPALCDTITYPHGRILTWYSGDAELLTTAAFTEAGCGFMPQLLLAALNAQGDL